MSEQQPWDQLPEESAASYARFVTYLHLGPRRSLVDAEIKHNGAKKRKKTQGANGSWTRDSAEHGWPDRAHAWDVHQMQKQGQRVVFKIIAGLEAWIDGATKELVATKPEGWQQATASIRDLLQLVPLEVIDHARRTSPVVSLPPGIDANGQPRLMSGTG